MKAKKEKKGTVKIDKATVLSKNVEKKELSSLDDTKKSEDKEEVQTNRVWAIVRKILVIITSPIWFPWKILFVRRPGHKYHEVSTGVKIFRIVRSPITKTFKFLVYLCIIALEVLAVYKIRYSSLSLPFTKKAVEDYYLKNSDLKEEYKEGMQEAFDKIDGWDTASKNNLYVIFDSDIVKMGFDNMDEKSLDIILDKFNNDESFREDVHEIAKNVDKSLSRGINEVSTLVDDESLETVLGPITKVGSVVDYRQVLDAAGAAVKANGENIETISIDEEELVGSVEMLANYSRGMSLNELVGE